MKKTRLFGLLVAVTTALFALSACGSSTQMVDIRIDMAEFSYTPSTIELKVGQEVTITLLNVGALEHEVMIGRDVMKSDGMPDGYMVDFFEFAGVEPSIILPEGMEGMEDMQEVDDHDEDGDDHAEEEGEDHEDDGDDAGDDHNEEETEHGHAGLMVTVQPGGEEVTLTFTVTEEMVGEWEIGCFFSGHYEAGMNATLIITS